MAEVTEDAVQVSISVDADTGKARRDIGATTEAVKELTGRIGSLNSALVTLRSKAVSGFSQLAGSMQQFSEALGSIDSFDKSIGNLAAGIGKLSQIDDGQVSSVANKVASFARGVGDLSNVDGSKITDLARGLSGIPESVRNMSGISQQSMSSLRESLEGIGTAASSAARYGTGIFNLARGIKLIPQGLQEFSFKNFSDEIESFGATIGRLSNVVTVFGPEAQSSARGLLSLGESLRYLYNLGGNVEELSSSLKNVSDATSKFVSDISSGTTDESLSRFERLAVALNKVTRGYERLSAARRAARGSSEVESGISSATNSFASVASAKLGSVAVSARNVAGAFLTVSKTIGGTLVSATRRWADLILRIARAPIDAIKSKIDSITRSFSRLGATIARITLYRALRGVLTSIASGFSEGLQNLYQWAIVAGNSFVASMDSMATSVQYFKNSVAAAASELIDAFAPVLDAIIDYAVAIINVINQLFAALTGHSTWRRAIKTQASYADAANATGSAAGKAAKAVEEYKNTVLSFDELHKLNGIDEPSSGGGGGGGGGGANTDYGMMFEEAAIDDFFSQLANTSDWTMLGQRIADGLNSWMYAIDWDAIDDAAATWSMRVWTTLNGFIDRLDWSELGDSIARGINVALHFVDDIVQNTSWSDLGAGIAGSLSQAVETLDWAALGRLLTDKLKIALETLNGFMNGNELYDAFDFDALRSSINRGIDAAFFNIEWGNAITDVTNGLAQVGRTIVSAASEVLANLESVISGYDWRSWGEGIASHLNEAIESVDWESIGRLLTDGSNVMFGALSGFFAEFDFDAAVDSLLTGIGAAIHNIDWESIGSTLSGSIKALLNIVAEVASETILNPAWWQDLLTTIFTAVRDIIVGFDLIGTLGDITLSLGDKLADWVCGIADWFVNTDLGQLLSSIGSLVWNAIDDVVASAEKLGEDVKGAFEDWLSDVSDWFSNTELGRFLGNVGTELWDALNQDFAAAMYVADEVKVALGNWVSGIASWLEESGMGRALGAVGSTVWETINNAVTGVAEFARPAADVAAEWWSDFAEWFAGTPLGQGMATIKNALGIAIDELVQWLIETPLGRGMSAIMNAVIEAINQVLEWFKNTPLGQTFAPLIEEWQLALEQLQNESFSGGEKVTSNFGTGIFSQKPDLITKITAISNEVKKLDAIKSQSTAWGKNIIANYATGINGNLSSLGTSVNNAKAKLQALWPSKNSSLTWGKNIVVNYASGMSKNLASVTKQVNNIKSKLGELDKVKSYTWGQHVSENFAKGIENKKWRVTNAAKSVANVVKSHIGFSEPEEGPLSNFHTFAPDMLAEFANGIEKSRYLVTDALTDLTSEMRATMTVGVDYDMGAPDLSGVDVQSTIANAVTLALAANTNSGNERPVEFVLKVDGQTMARATYRNEEELMRRGVILSAQL